MTDFQMVKGDITKDHHVQAIVNAANTSLLGGGGVDGAIHRAAGLELLASCYQSCLELAVENNIRSIAFPSISTGIYHFPLDEAAAIAVSTAKQFVEEHPEKLDVIKWVLFDDVTFEMYMREGEQRGRDGL